MAKHYHRIVAYDATGKVSGIVQCGGPGAPRYISKRDLKTMARSACWGIDWDREPHRLVFTVHPSYGPDGQPLPDPAFD